MRTPGEYQQWSRFDRHTAHFQVLPDSGPSRKSARYRLTRSLPGGNLIALENMEKIDVNSELWNRKLGCRSDTETIFFCAEQRQGAHHDTQASVDREGPPDAPTHSQGLAQVVGAQEVAAASARAGNDVAR